MTIQDTDVAAPVEIIVETDWIPNHKARQDGKYAFAYHITIVNHGEETVQIA